MVLRGWVAYFAAAGSPGALVIRSFITSLKVLGSAAIGPWFRCAMSITPEDLGCTAWGAKHFSGSIDRLVIQSTAFSYGCSRTWRSAMNPRTVHRSDANQQPIVDALRKVGVSVEVIGRPVDLLIFSRKNGLMLMEVKNPHKGKLTKDQEDFIARWPGQIHIVETVDEALQIAVGPY